MKPVTKYNQFRFNQSVMNQQQRDDVAIQLRKHGFHAHMETDTFQEVESDILFTDAKSSQVAMVNCGLLGMAQIDR